VSASTPTLLSAPPPAPAAFRLWRFLAAAPVCLAHGGLLAWAAVWAQRYWAPLLVFPLVAGLIAGATLVSLARLTQTANRTTLLAGAALSMLTVTVGQHYLCYRAYRADLQEQALTFLIAQQRSPDLLRGEGPMVPESFLQYLQWQAACGRNIGPYLARGPMAWATWALDGVLLAAAGVAVVLHASRQPFCNRCASWYRTTRSGMLGVEALERLAAVGVAIPPGAARARFCLRTCRGGCGPTCLELSARTAGRAGFTARIWLDTAGRNRVLEALDAPT